MKLVVMLQAFY